MGTKVLEAIQGASCSGTRLGGSFGHSEARRRQRAVEQVRCCFSLWRHWHCLCLLLLSHSNDLSDIALPGTSNIDCPNTCRCHRRLAATMADVAISEASRQKAAAAKSYIENMYRVQSQKSQDRRAR